MNNIINSANDPLNIVNGFLSQSMFLTIGVIGLIVLIIASILDGVFDAFDIGDGPLSLTTISLFASTFGFVGWTSVGFGASEVSAALIGAIVAFAVAIGSWGLSLIFKKAASTSSISTESLVGEKGTLTLGIREGSAGELSYSHSGSRHDYIAYADEPIPAGTVVQIISIRSGNSVQVARVVDTPIESSSDETPSDK